MSGYGSGAGAKISGVRVEEQECSSLPGAYILTIQLARIGKNTQRTCVAFSGLLAQVTSESPVRIDKSQASNDSTFIYLIVAGERAL
jgi:hypothetical protein